jgi:hypothetical protein
MADAGTDSGLELDERRRDSVVLGGGLSCSETRGVRACQPRGEHVRNSVPAFDGLDVPGECHQVAPEAVGGELLCHPFDVANRHRRLEIGQPGVDPLLRGQGVGGVQRLCHVIQPTRLMPSAQELHGVARRRIAT